MPELNLTIGHLSGFCFMALLASCFTSGPQLMRLLGWIFFWQLLTPVRPLFLDVPMLVLGWMLSESLYRLYVRR
jgi:hypothetical protein